MKFCTLLGLGFSVVLTTSVNATPLVRHARADEAPLSGHQPFAGLMSAINASVRAGSSSGTNNAGLDSLFNILRNDATLLKSENPTSQQLATFAEKLGNATNTTNANLAALAANLAGLVTNKQPDPTNHVDVEEQPTSKPHGSSSGTKELPAKPSRNFTALEEAQILYDLKSIIAGFQESPAPGAPGGYETSAFGGLVNDLLDLDDPKRTESHPDEAAPAQEDGAGGLTLLNLMRGLGASPNRGSSDPVGGFDMLHLMGGFGMSPAAFPALLGAFGIRRDQNAPGGSAPGGGSYDLTKLVAGMNQQLGDGKAAGGGSNLGFLGGGLGFLIGNAQAAGGGGASLGLGGLVANVLGRG